MTLRLPAMTPARLRQLWYVPLLALGMGLMLVRLLLMARLLDVASFGQYSAGLLVSGSFGMLACLGLQSLLQRELPVAIVRRRERAGAVLLLQCVAVGAGCSLALLLATAVLQPTVAGLAPAGLALGLVHGLAMQLFLLATVESRSRGEPLRFARDNLVRALAVLALGSAAAWLWGRAAPVLVAEALVSAALAVTFGRRQLQAARSRPVALWRAAWRRLGRLPWRSALALLSVATLAFIGGNADRWLAAEWLATEAFASYAFAWTVLLVAQSLQVVINASVFPMLARRWAQSGASAARSAGARMSLALLVAGSVVALPAWLAVDAAIARWFAPYEAARAVLPLLMAVAVLRVSDFWSSILIVTGREARLLRVNLLGLVLGALAWGLGLAATGAEPASAVSIAWLAVALAAFAYTTVAWTAWWSRPAAADGVRT